MYHFDWSGSAIVLLSFQRTASHSLFEARMILGSVKATACTANVNKLEHLIQADPGQINPSTNVLLMTDSLVRLLPNT